MKIFIIKNNIGTDAQTKKIPNSPLGASILKYILLLKKQKW